MRIRAMLRLVAGAALGAGALTAALAPWSEARAADVAETRAAVLRLAALGETRLPPDVLESLMDSPRGAATLREAGGAPHAMAAARRALPALERRFILDAAWSSLDALPPEERAIYRAFSWHDADYPGGPEGPNEAAVLEMDAALSRVRPERRANSTPTAVVTQPEFDEAMWRHIQSRRRDVPGQEPRQMDVDALAAFRAMEEAARREGVTLIIVSSDRLPQVAERNAARVNNPYATARFSSHILGLAMDLRLSDDHTTVSEVTTQPMENIIAMRRTAPHKWMFLRGAAWGWYPYQHEPWHWEYNPPGFRARFRQGLAPPAAPAPTAG